MGYSILKNAKVTPPEVQVKLDLAEVRAKLDDPTLSKEERAELRKKMHELVAVDAVRQERLAKPAKPTGKRPRRPFP